MTSSEHSRWLAADDVNRGDAYDQKWRAMAAAGKSIHGEADFVCRFQPATVLDAGCGTGRVAVELAARGIEVVGVDLDPKMLVSARTKAPTLSWFEADLTTVSLTQLFEVVVAAGNVMIFLAPGSERKAIANLTQHLESGGRFVTGFQLDSAYTLADFDADCAAAGLTLAERWSTWDGDEWTDNSGYAVSVYQSTSASDPT